MSRRADASAGITFVLPPANSTVGETVLRVRGADQRRDESRAVRARHPDPRPRKPAHGARRTRRGNASARECGRSGIGARRSPRPRAPAAPRHCRVSGASRAPRARALSRWPTPPPSRRSRRGTRGGRHRAGGWRSRPTSLMASVAPAKSSGRCFTIQRAPHTPPASSSAKNAKMRSRRGTVPSRRKARAIARMTPGVVLHVNGSAAIQDAVVDLGAEGRMRPVRLVDRHDVEMGVDDKGPGIRVGTAESGDDAAAPRPRLDQGDLVSHFLELLLDEEGSPGLAVADVSRSPVLTLSIRISARMNSRASRSSGCGGRHAP